LKSASKGNKPSKAKNGPKILTFGCRLNAYEAEVMRDHAHHAGMDNAIIVNSCTVTAEAERQTRQAIRKARRENPDAKIIVASGYSNDPIMANYREYGFCAAIAKPFDLKQINNILSSILS
jgi:tRNA A37 methylthiotransferase MiaB